MRLLMSGLLLVALSGCDGSDADPEEAIREWVARGETAVEATDRGDLLQLISEDYADSRGNDRDQLGDILRLQFLRQKSITLLTGIDEITLYGDTAAQVTLTVGMAGTDNSAWGFRADAYQFELELIKPDDVWLLIGARWGELGGDLR